MRLRQILRCNNRLSCLTPPPSRAEPLKAQLASELSAAASDEEKASVRAEFEARERILEHEIDFTPRELSMALQVNYSTLRRFDRSARSARAHPTLPSQ